jgi:lysophospholipase L1-like esterase
MTTYAEEAVMKGRMKYALAAAIAAAALLLAAAAVGAPADRSASGASLRSSTRSASLRGTWIGSLEGSRAFVAVVSDGDQIVAYVCDDGTIGSWFFGTDDSADHVQLRSPDGSLLDVTLGDQAAGTFTKDGRSYPFVARSTDKAVLFRADAYAGSTRVLAGWIQNGSESRGTLITGSTLQTAPTLTSSISLIVDTSTIQLAPAPMTPDTLASPTANTTKFVWGAAGDSYASGEGDPEHGISDPTNPDNFSGLSWGNDASIFVPNGSASLAADVTTCHRSDQAGAPQANRTLRTLYPGMSFVLGFVACSGATTWDVEHAGYTGPSAVPASMLGYAKVTQPAQLDRIDNFKSTQGQLDALYMSIGGNDAGFGDIVADCISPLGPADCGQADNSLLNDNLATLASRYLELGGRIVNQFGNLPVLISEYPNPIDNGFGAPCQGDDYNLTGEVGFGAYDDALKNNVAPSEAAFAYGIPARLDTAVANAAAANGWIPVVSHLPRFLGHGICTLVPFANLNSRALRRQGHDIPGTFPFVFSSGFMHPNDTGYAWYGAAIATSLQRFVDARARTGLVTPANLRIAAATLDGPITVRWNDRSTSENAYEIEVLPARTQDAALIVVPPGGSSIAGGGFRLRISGIGAEQYVHQVSGGGQFLYRVRACQTGIAGPADNQCGPWSAYVSGTNVLPASPTGLRLSTFSSFSGGRLVLYTSFSWNPQPDAIEYVVRVEAQDGSFSETRTSNSSYVGSVLLNSGYKVSACNRIACTPYVTAS